MNTPDETPVKKSPYDSYTPEQIMEKAYEIMMPWLLKKRQEQIEAERVKAEKEAGNQTES